MDSVNAVKEVKICGSSYVVYITKELKMINVAPGDKIRVSIEKEE